MTINFVQQPTSDTCTSACLAMITGVNVNDVIDDFHMDWTSKATNPSEFLSHNYVRHTVNKDVFCNRVEWGFIYLLTVASLNIDGGLHHIVLDLTGDSAIVLDPNMGKTGKKYYVNWSDDVDNDLQVNLKSWMVDIKITNKASND